MNKYPQTPEYVIDLHGSSKREAEETLSLLFSSQKYSHVRIITGKGTFRENGPVLREFVKTFLEDQNMRFYPAKQKDGGEGALEVFFRDAGAL